jgi:cytochrome b6-f complex iron-sulfur subunit
MPATPAHTDRDPAPVSRRDFFELAGKAFLALTALLGLGGLMRFLDFQTAPAPKTEFDLGPADRYAPGSRTPVAEAHAILVRTAGGFEAYSAVCPHLGCEVTPEGDGFNCPCHGSRFDAHGVLLKGPAAASLRALRVEQASNGHVLLYTRP